MNAHTSSGMSRSISTRSGCTCPTVERGSRVGEGERVREARATQGRQDLDEVRGRVVDHEDVRAGQRRVGIKPSQQCVRSRDAFLPMQIDRARSVLRGVHPDLAATVRAPPARPRSNPLDGAREGQPAQESQGSAFRCDCTLTA